MIEDRLLLWKFKQGSRKALARIYEKYEAYLLTLATALLNDINAAEDTVHDFFLSFAQSAEKIRLQGRLKSYLATCVANRARDQLRTRQRQPMSIDDANSINATSAGPELSAVCSEQLEQLSKAITKLPYEQREVIILHLQGQIKFAQIAKSQNVSINTAQSRYRYGMKKLRSLLNDETEK